MSWELTELTNSAQLRAEGVALQHCAGATATAAGEERRGSGRFVEGATQVPAHRHRGGGSGEKGDRPGARIPQLTGIGEGVAARSSVGDSGEFANCPLTPIERGQCTVGDLVREGEARSDRSLSLPGRDR